MSKKKPTYSEAIAEIEEVIADIENDTLDVDILSEKVNRVAKLIAICKEKLYKTEEEVEQILKDLNDA